MHSFLVRSEVEGDKRKIKANKRARVCYYPDAADLHRIGAAAQRRSALRLCHVKNTRRVGLIGANTRVTCVRVHMTGVVIFCCPQTWKEGQRRRSYLQPAGTSAHACRDRAAQGSVEQSNRKVTSKMSHRGHTLISCR